MENRKETTIEERKLVIKLSNEGKSQRNMAKVVRRSINCIQKILQKFKKTGKIDPKISAPKIAASTSNTLGRSVSAETVRRVLRKAGYNGRVARKKPLIAKRKVLKDIKIDPKLSAVKLAAETSRIMGRNVSAETVRNVIRHAGYSSRVARKKPFISLQSQKKRFKFAKTYQLKTDNFWKKVIFSDESKFNIFGSGGHRTVWRKLNTALDPKNSRSTVKHGGGSVMVWGVWILSNGVGNLVFIDGIMDHKLYVDILNSNLKESAKKLGLDGNFIFQLGND
ncbi:transposable element Tc1 transposase [Trichonephila clavipes]|nr:transposable element Tc1 transposase [Trichonephila clavipes]